MKTRTLVLSTIAGFAMASTVARADFVVQFAPMTNPAGFSTVGTVTTNGSGQPVSFSISIANDGYWRIYSTNPAVDSLGTVSFTGSVSGRDLRLIIGRPGIIWNPFADAGEGALADWVGGVSENGAKVSVQASIYGNLTSLGASRLSRLKVGGIAYGSLTHAGSNTTINGVPDDIVSFSAGSFGIPGYPLGLSLYRGSLSSASTSSGDFIGGITCYNNAAIGAISILNGSFLGDVTTNGGAISSITTGVCIGGSFLTSGGTIQTLRAGVANPVGFFGAKLVVDSGVYSIIRSNALVNAGPTGTITSIQAPGGVFANITAGSNITEVSSAFGHIGGVTADGLYLTTSEIKSLTGNIGTISAINSTAQLWSNLRSPQGKVGAVTVGGSMVTNIESRDGVDSVVIGQDMAGQIALQKGLASTSSIKIGRSLLAGASVALNNASLTSGAVGLAGQVIINSVQNAGVFSGDVRVKRGGGLADLILTQPDYSLASASLGGGAVGLVPFQLHYQDSVPATTAWVGNPKPTPPEMLQTEFNHTPGPNITPKDVTLRFYGPVRSELIAGAVTVNMLVGPSDYAIDVTPYCIITGNSATGGSASRTLTIRGVTGHRFMHGRYQIVPKPATTGTNGTRFLYCDNVDSKPDVAAFDYRFNLLLDCNNDGIADRDQIAADPSLALVNGIYLDECSQNGGCIADFNGDGFVEFTDFDDFITAFEGGAPSSDVNSDGFLDFSDFDYFVAFFEEGC